MNPRPRGQGLRGWTTVKARFMPRPTRQRLLPPPPPPLPAQRWQPPLRFLHIPKTAGTSAIVELQALGYDLGSASQATMEACYPPYKSSSPSTLNFVLLREPRSHVLSQFLECRFTRFGSWVTWADSLRHAEWQKECKRTRCGINRFGERFGGSRNRTAASILAGFEPWIRHFARVQGSARRSGVDDFGCYDARSLQTRALTCARRGGYASHHYDGEANLAGAMEVVRQVDLLGVTELYHESLCLVHFRVQGALPPSCVCNADANRSAGGGTMRHEHRTHGGPRDFGLSALPQALLPTVDAVTRDDAQLYEAALRRVVRDIRSVETQAGARVLCRAAPRYSAPGGATGQA